MRYRRAAPDERDGGDLPGPDAVPPLARVGFVGLVVGPEPRRQVDVPERSVFHERGDEEIRAEEVLVLDGPRGWVSGVLEGQGAQATINKYNLAGPGQWVDGPEQILYPFQPPH